MDPKDIELKSVSDLTDLIKDLAVTIDDQIYETLGYRIPIDQLISMLKKRNRRMVEFTILYDDKDPTEVYRKGYRTEPIDSEPDTYWVKYYTSIELVCKRKVHIKYFDNGSIVVSASNDETIMNVTLEDGTEKRIKIETNVDPENSGYTINELELES